MTLFLQLFDRILPNLEKLQFFLVVCPYLAVFGDKWHVWRILINIGNILKAYWKVARLDNMKNIENIDKLLNTYWKHIGKILVMITPACVQLRIRNFGIYAVWPKKGHMRNEQKIQSFGGPGSIQYYSIRSNDPLKKYSPHTAATFTIESSQICRCLLSS